MPCAQMVGYLGKGSVWFGLALPRKLLRLLKGDGAPQTFWIQFRPTLIGAGSDTQNLEHWRHDVWLARTLVRVDGGPMLDAPRLGPVLRMLGFQSIRRRRGTRKVSVWLPPGVSPPPLGRPPRGSHTGSATAILPLAAATRGRRCGEDRESSHFDLLEVTRCCHDARGPYHE